MRQGEDTSFSHKRRRQSRAHLTIIRHLNHSASRWALLPVLLVIWLAPFLGGSVEPWAMAILYALLALLFVIYPVTFAVRLPYRLFLIALLVLPLLAFLPVSVTGIPAWRAELIQRFALPFPKTISPQPWLTFDSYLSWLGGVAWIYWLSGQGWTREIRKPLAELFAIGMILLTVCGLVGYHTQHPLPFWHAQRLFGPFPNRNQTADLLALTFVLLSALIHVGFVKKARITLVWIVGWLLVGYGLILNYSRAGIILAALGVGIYWFVNSLTHPTTKKIIIGVAAFALIGALFIAFGGDTLARFTHGDDNRSMTSDFRRLIFRDTLNMTAEHPWFGVGLSSFPAVYPFFRKLALVNDGIIHPESDWLWLASEIGWPGTLMILGGASWLVWRAFCGAFKRPHPLRLVSAICGALFVLHGFFDVSGHRFGTFFPACFLFCLAWPGQMTAKAISPHRSHAVALGLALIAIGWFICLDEPTLWPSRASLAGIKKMAAQQITHGNGAEAYALTDAALRWAPLDWQLYYQRGTARILQKRDWAETLRDYQRTNYLERNSPIPPDNQGLAWLSYRPELAALPWAEALHRLPLEEGNRKYARYLEYAAPYPRLRSQLEAIVGNNIGRIIIHLNYADKNHFGPLLADFLKNHTRLEKLDPADQRALFDVWVGKGNPAEAIAVLQKTPGLLPACNIPLATALARTQHFQEACELAFKTLPEPLLPKLETRASEEDLTREFYAQGSLGAGMALYKLQMSRQDNYAALSSLERLQTLPQAPLYFRYFEAKLQAANGNWDKAWDAISDYIYKNHL